MENSGRKKVSWFGALQNWVNNLNGPSWVWFVVLWVLLFVLGVIIMGLESGFSNITIDPMYILVLFQLCYSFFLINFLDKQAISTLEVFQPQLKSNDVNYSILKDKFTYLPSKTVNRITAFTVLLFIFIGYSIFSVPTRTNSQIVDTGGSFANSPIGYYQFLFFSIMWLFNFMFIYHTVRQIRGISFVFSDCIEVNIFQQAGLYSFTKLGASTGIGLVLSTPVWLLLAPDLLSLIINIVYSIGAIFIFFFPLVGIHNLLAKQKSIMLSKSQMNKEGIINELFTLIEQKDYTEAKELDAALAAVDSAHNEIKSISTWPWDNETIRRLSGAILLPIVIWIIQFFLSQILSV